MRVTYELRGASIAPTLMRSSTRNHLRKILMQMLWRIFRFRKANSRNSLRLLLHHSYGHKLLPDYKALSGGKAQRGCSVGAVRHFDSGLWVGSGSLGGRHLGIHRAADRWKSKINFIDFLSDV